MDVSSWTCQALSQRHCCAEEEPEGSRSYDPWRVFGIPEVLYADTEVFAADVGSTVRTRRKAAEKALAGDLTVTTAWGWNKT